MTPNFSCTLFNVSGSAHEKFGVMGRFDNVLFANVLVSSDPNTKSVEFLWVGAGSTLVLRLYFYYRSLFFFVFVLAIITFY